MGQEPPSSAGLVRVPSAQSRGLAAVPKDRHATPSSLHQIAQSARAQRTAPDTVVVVVV